MMLIRFVYMILLIMANPLGFVQKAVIGGGDV